MRRYQIVRFGSGFPSTHGSGIHTTVLRLRGKLRTTTRGPYHISYDIPGKGAVHLTGEYDRPSAVRRAKGLLRFQPTGTRVIVSSDLNYDQPAWSMRSKEYMPPPPPESPLITYGRKWVGKSTYGFGASGPPGPSDCSGFTQDCVEHVYQKTLIHMANEQMKDDRIAIFMDGDRAQSGDFVFFNYGRLAAGMADHVEFYVKNGLNLGSRPSTGGIAWKTLDQYDYDHILCYGRLK